MDKSDTLDAFKKLSRKITNEKKQNETTKSYLKNFVIKKGFSINFPSKGHHDKIEYVKEK